MGSKKKSSATSRAPKAPIRKAVKKKSGSGAVRAPKAPVSGRRKLNEGLRRWNEARSFFASENRKLGRKFNGVEINALARSFLSEYQFRSFDSRDLSGFVATEVPLFYSNALDVPFSALVGDVYYQIDSVIRGRLPKGINVVVETGWVAGSISFNTGSYEYGESGLRELVEAVREEVSSAPADEQYPTFEGVIKRVDGAPEGSVRREDYYIEWVLVVYGEIVSDISTMVPAKDGPVEPRFGVSVSKKKKVGVRQGLGVGALKTVPVEKYEGAVRKVSELEGRIAELESRLAAMEGAKGRKGAVKGKAKAKPVKKKKKR